MCDGLLETGACWDRCQKRGESLQKPETRRWEPNQREIMVVCQALKEEERRSEGKAGQGDKARPTHIRIANLGKAPPGRCDGRAKEASLGTSNRAGGHARGETLLLLRLRLYQLRAAAQVQCMSQAGNAGLAVPITLFAGVDRGPGTPQVSCTPGLDVCSTITPRRLDPSCGKHMFPTDPFLHIMSRFRRRSLKPVLRRAGPLRRSAAISSQTTSCSLFKIRGYIAS
jgi:hypothetical protein